MIAGGSRWSRYVTTCPFAIDSTCLPLTAHLHEPGCLLTGGPSAGWSLGSTWYGLPCRRKPLPQHVRERNVSGDIRQTILGASEGMFSVTPQRPWTVINWARAEQRSGGHVRDGVWLPLLKCDTRPFVDELILRTRQASGSGAKRTHAGCDAGDDGDHKPEDERGTHGATECRPPTRQIGRVPG